jgi:hypothetical protein
MLSNSLSYNRKQPVRFNSAARFVNTPIVLPEINGRQMLVLMDRADSVNPPALRPGFTLINQVSNATYSRSITVSYKHGPHPAATLASPTLGAYVVVDHGKTIGSTNTVNLGTATSTIIQVPSIGLLNTDGNSLVLFLQYTLDSLQSISAPYTLVNRFGGYVEKINVTSLANTTASSLGGIYQLGSIFEIRP